MRIIWSRIKFILSFSRKRLLGIKDFCCIITFTIIVNFKISRDALRRVKEGRDLVEKIVSEKRGTV